MRPYKYYFQTRKNFFDRPDDKNIVRNMPNEEIIVSENVDLPEIELHIDRLKQNEYSRPKNSEFEKYKEIKQEDYNLYLSIILDVFKALKWSDQAEFYNYKPYSIGSEVVMFSNDKTNRYRVMIHLDADLEHGWFQFNYSRSYTRRNTYRKDGTPIRSEVFEYILMETIRYIENDQNLWSGFDEYVKMFHKAIEGQIEIKRSPEATDLSPIISNLQEQIKHIETRLINNDRDQGKTRERLRGRMEGLKSALKEIRAFERINVE